MKFLAMVVILIPFRILLAEGAMPQNDQEFMRYMQAKAEQAQSRSICHGRGAFRNNAKVPARLSLLSNWEQGRWIMAKRWLR